MLTHTHMACLQMPVWVEAALLLLDCLACTVPKKAPTPPASVPAAPGQAAAPPTAAAGGGPSAPSPGAPPAQALGVQGEAPRAPAPASGAGAAPQATGAAADKQPSTGSVLSAALLEASKLWRACGMLDDAEQVRGCVDGGNEDWEGEGREAQMWRGVSRAECVWCDVWRFEARMYVCPKLPCLEVAEVGAVGATVGGAPSPSTPH